jgi:predicted nucleotidyltransferase
MNGLSAVLSSRVRAELFRLLFGLSDAPVHMRELQRRSGMSIGTVQQDLGKLVKLDLISQRRDGNRVCFNANKAHPLYEEIHRMVLKTSGLADVLREALAVEGVQFAFVFGSVARGEAGASSDVDLMVVGDIGLRKLTGRLAGVAEVLGREINPHVMTPEEFRKRLRDKEHFVARIMQEQKLFVTGSSDELATMAG